MRLTFLTDTAKLASDEELARSILDNADGSPLSTSFLLVAAKELAKRIAPDHDMAEPCGQMPKGNLSQGRAEPSALHKRMTQQMIDSLSVGKDTTK